MFPPFPAAFSPLFPLFYIPYSFLTLLVRWSGKSVGNLSVWIDEFLQEGRPLVALAWSILFSICIAFCLLFYAHSLLCLIFDNPSSVRII
jgi:hypothetical protein